MGIHWVSSSNSGCLNQGSYFLSKNYSTCATSTLFQIQHQNLKQWTLKHIINKLNPKNFYLKFLYSQGKCIRTQVWRQPFLNVKLNVLFTSKHLVSQQSSSPRLYLTCKPGKDRWRVWFPSSWIFKKIGSQLGLLASQRLMKQLIFLAFQGFWVYGSLLERTAGITMVPKFVEAWNLSDS